MIASEADMQGYVAFDRTKHRFEGALTTAVLAEGRVVGVVGMNYLDWVEGHAALGYWLGVEFRGRGLMTAVSKTRTKDPS